MAETSLAQIPLVLALIAPSISPSLTPLRISPDTIGVGSNSTLDLTITNISPDTAAQGLAFTDDLPAGVVIATPANVTSDCDIENDGRTEPQLTVDDVTDSISLTNGVLGAGSSCTISVDVTSSTPGIHTNLTGTLTSNLGSGGTATDDLTVTTDRPGFSKSFSPSTVPLGGRSTLTFTIDNSANLSKVTFLGFTDNLPTGLEVAGPSNAATTCGSANTTRDLIGVRDLWPGF